jgi:ferredoxin
MARLLSVNVGLPRDIAWKGRTVHTGVWKSPVHGRCRVARLNLEGDGQGDLAGHGGEHRAVFVYQIESYRYWQEQLKRTDLVDGQFGENFTVEGLPDDAVCIGDWYQIGTALFEVTQPRVTCFRVGIFNGGESMTPGVVGAVTRVPHPPGDQASTGPQVSFARSGISAHWNGSRYESILEMAEACDGPVRWACRTGVCHSRESGLVSGAVVYEPEPLDKPADGNLLICCSQPTSDVVIDL